MKPPSNVPLAERQRPLGPRAFQSEEHRVARIFASLERAGHWRNQAFQRCATRGTTMSTRSASIPMEDPRVATTFVSHERKDLCFRIPKIASPLAPRHWLLAPRVVIFFTNLIQAFTRRTSAIQKPRPSPFHTCLS